MGRLNDAPIAPLGGEGNDPIYRSLVREWRVGLIDYLRVSAWESAYPIGAVYTSIDNTSPSVIFGGTWAVLSAVSPYTWNRLT